MAKGQELSTDDDVETGPLGTVGEHRVRRTEREAPVNLHTLLRMCEAGEVRCSEKTGRPSAATVQAIAARLTDGDFYLGEPMAAFAWPLLLQAGGLARIESGRLRLTPKGRAALDKRAAEVIRQLWVRWLSHAVIDEFSRIEQIKGQRAANVLSAARTRRETVAEALTSCPAGEWEGVDALFTRMQHSRLNPTIARSERALWRLYLVDAEYGSLGYDGFHQWELLEGRYTLAVLFEYAATLGLIDVEYVHPAGERDDFRENWGADEMDALSRYDGLQALRLNDLGAYVLGLTGEYTPPEPDAADGATLRVLPTLQVVAAGRLTPDDEIVLSTWCTRMTKEIWAIEGAGLLDAIHTGHRLDEFAALLRRRSQNELPATVQALLEEITSRANQLSDSGVVRMIECADPAVADRVLHDRSAGRYCRRLGDRHLAVPVDQEAKFRAALLSLGYVLPGQRQP
ncbi:helicase-associated domain-containing protein [Georgenia yuyongxinii]